MKILRTIVAVVVGYVLYAAASMLLVGPVTAGEGIVVLLLGLVGLVVIGVAVGLLASAIAGEATRAAAWVVAGLVALATAANLALQLGAEPLWYKIGTLVLTVPSILVVALRR